MYWHVGMGPLFLHVGNYECGCAGMSIGLRNKFRAWRAFKEWGRRRWRPDDVPHIHEAMRLARANG